MAKFKVVVAQKAGRAAADMGEGAYDLEMEALGPIGAEIVEVAAGTDQEFIEAA